MVVLLHYQFGQISWRTHLKDTPSAWVHLDKDAKDPISSSTQLQVEEK